MAITYDKKQRAAAKESGLFLVSMDIGGASFQGPVTSEERQAMSEFFDKFIKRHMEILREEKAKVTE